MLPAQHLDITVLSGVNISPKGASAKVDAYYTVGAVTSSDEWCRKPVKSKPAKGTTEPAWFGGVHSFEFLEVDAAKSVKVEIWDKGLIGKGDLLASVTVPFASLKLSKVPVNEEWDLQYATKSTIASSVVPKVAVQYIFWTREWKLDADKKSVALQKAAEELIMCNADSFDVPIDKVRAVAQKFVEVAQGKTVITEKSQLAQLAQATGLTAAFSLFDDNAKIGAAKSSARSGGAFVDYLWDVLDTNKDGQIDFQELLMGIALHTSATPSDRAAFYFDVFDTDRSGCLSKDEVVKLWQKTLQVLFSSFKHESIDKLKTDPDLADTAVDWSAVEKVFDNVINDFNKLHLAIQLTDAVFNHVDKDNSGEISKAEYMAFFSDEGVRASLSAMASRAVDSAAQQIDSVVRKKLSDKIVSVRL